MTDPDNIESDIDEADTANGEPDTTSENRTGEEQAAENRENDPPA